MSAELAPPPLKEALQTLAGNPAGDVLGMLLRVFHGLLGARPAAAAAGVEAELELEIVAFRERGQRLEEFLDVDQSEDRELDADSLWVQTDLTALLDAMARLLTECARRAATGDQAAEVMRRFIREVLFEHLAGMCRGRGWFLLEEVMPYQTPFNAQVHKAVGARDESGQAGVVVELTRVGRRSVETGALLEPAQVIVGR